MCVLIKFSQMYHNWNMLCRKGHTATTETTQMFPCFNTLGSSVAPVIFADCLALCGGFAAESH